MKNLFCLILLLFFFDFCSIGKNDKKLDWIIDEANPICTELKARINGKEHVLLNVDDGVCYSVIERKDYNGDGYDELCLEIINGCGGNCCGNSLQIFYYDGNKFGNTKSYGWDWDGVKLKKQTKRTFFVVETINTGVENTVICNNKIETFIFENFALKLVELKEEHKINSIKELTSKNYGMGFIEYDLDGDGINDEISAEYWERWGTLRDMKIIFGNKKEFSFGNISAKRIGILASKTNNYCDLVLDCDKIYKWNGNKYIKPEKE